MSGKRVADSEVVVRLLATQPGAFAGSVLAHGADVAHVRVGQAIFGRSPGSYMAGETHVFPGDDLASCPEKLGPDEAAILADKGPTAVHALRLAKVSRDSRLLLQDASTCIGALLLQIAKAHGAFVTALCPDRMVPLVWDLGADEVFARERLQCNARYDAIIGTGHPSLREAKQVRLDSNTHRVHIFGRTVWLDGIHTPIDSDITLSRMILQDLALWVESTGLFPIAACRE